MAIKNYIELSFSVVDVFICSIGDSTNDQMALYTFYHYGLAVPVPVYGFGPISRHNIGLLIKSLKLKLEI